jgi:hypothetical protein
LRALERRINDASVLVIDKSVDNAVSIEKNSFHLGNIQEILWMQKQEWGEGRY